MSSKSPSQSCSTARRPQGRGRRPRASAGGGLRPRPAQGAPPDRRRGRRGRGPAARPLLRRHRRLDRCPGPRPSRHFHPDTLRARPRSTTYIFGFRNVTGLTDDPAVRPEEQGPALGAAVLGDREGEDFRVQLTNLGLAQRPDLFDAHTAPLARVPERDPVLRRRADRLGLGAGRAGLHLRLPPARPRHLHVPLPRGGRGARAHGDDRPRVRAAAQDGNTALYPSGKYAYNDGDGSTGYDREFAMFLSEVWARLPLGRRAHPAARVERLPGRLRLLNGRVYPDTLAPNGSIDPSTPVIDAQRGPARPGRDGRTCSPSRCPRW